MAIVSEKMGIPMRSQEESLDVISGWDQEKDIVVADISGDELDLSKSSEDLLPNGVAISKYVCVGMSNETTSAGVVKYKLDDRTDTTIRTKGINSYDRYWITPVIKSIVKSGTTITNLKLYFKDRNIFLGKYGQEVDVS